MRRRQHLSVEALEGRALLSQLALPQGQSQPNAETVAVRLYTARAQYVMGSNVPLTFKEQNRSAHPITVVAGPSVEGFIITRNGVPVWQSNVGATADSLVPTTLKHGQAITAKSTWDGTSNLNADPYGYGVYQVRNQLAPNSVIATFGIAPPMTLTLHVTPRSTRLGNTINVDVTETNHGRAPLTVQSGSSVATLTSSRGNVEYYTASAGSTTTTLAPGASRTFQLTWDGTQNVATTTPGHSYVQPGTYQLNVGVDGLTTSRYVRMSPAL